MPNDPLRSARLPLPDALRGAAALAVALFHFGAANLAMPDWLLQALRFGWIGVDAFFVLSGFVIARLLLAADVDAPAFLARRMLRLMPPYLAACVLIVVLDALSAATPGFRGAPFAFPAANTIACHLSYSCALFGINWLSPVFWTLAVEVQFYLLAVLLAVASRASRGITLRVLALCGIAALASMAGDAWFDRYLPLFAIGAVSAVVRGRHLPLAASAALAQSTGGWVAWQLPAAQAIVVLGCAVLLVSAAQMQVPRWSAWLGAISYSLYLLHVTIGGRVINLAMRLDPGPLLAIGATILALGIALLASTVFCRWVEQPSIRLAARVAYRRATAPAPTIGAPGLAP
jgi:peptidoglycan/LPS O-acetylase OafA/YrhL